MAKMMSTLRPVGFDYDRSGSHPYFFLSKIASPKDVNLITEPLLVNYLFYLDVI